ncbi:MAG: glycoside hydrolase, partial [Clostridia bacterium]|nr:glycoside hydrolase [Clostridia bacterium]
IYNDLLPYAGSFPVWNGLVPDFTQPEAKKIFADYHRDTLIKLGIDGFKLDECDGSDYTGCWSFPSTSSFPGGADGELMRQLLGTLYTQAIWQALDGAPTVSSVRSMGSLAAPYPFVLYSDLYNHKEFIRGVVNQGFSGILWSPELRAVDSKKELLRRLQTLVFSTQCLVNAWYCEDRCPWFVYDCEDEVRELLELRERLIPMLKAAFDTYHETGKPPIRALVMDWTDDRETWAIDDEYLFCDTLLVAPMTAESDTRRVYIPDGTWVDFYTKEPVTPGWHDVTTENIPVYERV